MPVASRRRKPSSLDPEAQAVMNAAQSGAVLTRDFPLIGAPRFTALGTFALSQQGRLYNPDAIGIETYAQMRLYGVIRAGLSLIKAPILARIKRATVECDDPKIKAVVEHAFLDSGLLYRTVRQQLHSEEFGVSAMEKVWDVADRDITYQTTDEDTGDEYEESAWSGPLLLYKELREVNPLTVLYIRRRDEPKDGKPADGSFDGFVQSNVAIPTWAQQYTQKTPDGIGIPVEAAKSFVYAREVEFGNLWGNSRLKPVYPYWRWADYLLKLWMAWAERKVAPPRKVRYPVGVAPDGRDNQQYALDLGATVDDVSAVALPNTRVLTTRGAPIYDWEIEEIATADRSGTFEAIWQVLETAILRAMVVPERLFTSGQGYGLFSTDAEAHGDVFLMGLDQDLFDALDAFHQYVLQPFLVVNFGVKQQTAAHFAVTGISDDDADYLAGILTSLMANADLQQRVDLDALAARFGLPLKELSDEPEPAAPAAVGTPPGEPQATEPPPVGAEPEAPAEPTEPPAGTPPNLALDAAELWELEQLRIIAGLFDHFVETGDLIMLDDSVMSDLIMLAFDSTLWDVSPDPKALSGYRVVDKQTGKRLSGYAGQKIIDSYLAAAKSGGKAAAKKAQSDAQKAATKAAAEAKRAAAAAKRASDKAQRDQTAASKKAAHAALVAQHQKDTSAKQAAAKATREDKQKAAAEKKAAAAAAKQTAADQKTRTADLAARTATASAEKSLLEQTTQKQSAADAAKTLQAKGWNVGATNADKASAVAAASDAARSSPDSIYSVVKTAQGFTVISKPRSSVTPKTTPTNIAAEDA